MKLSAIAFVLASIALVAKFYKKKWASLGIAIFAIGAFLWWVVFGMALSPGTFWTILLSNSQRVYGIGYQAVGELITTFKITGKVNLIDGWILAAYLAFVGLILSKTKNKEWVIFPAISYLATYLFFGGESYGWYRIPFYPFIFMSLGWASVRLVRQVEVGGLFLYLIPIGVSASTLVSASGRWLLIWRLAPLLALGFSVVQPKKVFVRLLLIGFVVVSLGLGLVHNLSINSIFWQRLI